METYIEPSPAPYTKLSKINEMHKKEGQGWRKRNLLLSKRGECIGGNFTQNNTVVLLPRLLEVMLLFGRSFARTPSDMCQNSLKFLNHIPRD